MNTIDWTKWHTDEAGEMVHLLHYNGHPSHILLLEEPGSSPGKEVDLPLALALIQRLSEYAAQLAADARTMQQHTDIISGEATRRLKRAIEVDEHLQRLDDQ